MCRSPRSLSLLVVLLSLLMSALTVHADDGGQAYKPTTTDNPQIPLDHLELMLQPLTEPQLKQEADAWIALLQQKVSEVVQTQLALKQMTDTDAQTTGDQGTGEAPTADAPTGDATTGDATTAPPPSDATQQQLSDRLVQLRSERSALVDRTSLVLDEWEAKGGDPAAHRQYISAVTGVKAADLDTSVLWSTISGWFTAPEGGIRWGKNIGFFLLTLIITWIVARIIANTVRRALRMVKNTTELLRDFLVKLVRGAIYLVGFIIALAMLEVNIAPLVAAIGGIAFVVAFALQGTLSNFASGIMILVYRPFDVGDAVEVAGISGIVENMTLVSTSVRTFDNKAIVVPNNSIWNNVITNVTGKDTRRVDLVFGISYSDDMKKAGDILLSVVKEHPLVLEDPEPMIRVHELGDSSVNLICRPWVKTADYWTVYWDVIPRVKERFDAEGITIPFPQRDVHLFNQSKD